MLTRDEELRLECLRIVTGAVRGDCPASTLVDAARKFHDFVTGADRAALTKQAKAAVDALR